jgi:hypothetical protein
MPGKKVDLFTSACRVMLVSQPTETVEKRLLAKGLEA